MQVYYTAGELQVCQKKQLEVLIIAAFEVSAGTAAGLLFAGAGRAGGFRRSGRTGRAAAGSRCIDRGWRNVFIDFDRDGPFAATGGDRHFSVSGGLRLESPLLVYGHDAPVAAFERNGFVREFLRGQFRRKCLRAAFFQAKFIRNTVDLRHLRDHPDLNFPDIVPRRE